MAARNEEVMEIGESPISLLFADCMLVGKYINLNQQAVELFGTSAEKENPLTDSNFCKGWVENLHRKLGCDFSWGGYLENRSTLWRGSYLEPTKFTHLGVDINHAAGTPVYCPVEFVVVERYVDLDNDGGWGGRLLVETRDGRLVIFAHLELANLSIGKWYPFMTRIGYIAEPKTNGGWFPHLHIQGIRDISLMRNIDGYANDSKLLAIDYPNPLDILELEYELPSIQPHWACWN